MHLRRLELQGFKTFADRTELEFGPGITAIVGPNGSGKSNLFDAIRWVLGETSHRALRTHRTEDVIFAGTSTRRPHGLAQVELTLDNTGGLLPVAFTEVTVTRRATRASESEFFLNRTPCRLRDIQALFSGTGLGGRSYAMIAQGEVEAILNASPQERRAWLVEAAGIARYKRRQEDARRRLQQVEEDLERLGDLLQELKAQQVYLTVQAEAAERYLACERALREAELYLHVEAFRRLASQLERLEAQYAAAHQGLEELRAQAEVFERAFADTRAKAEEASARLEAASGELLAVVEAARACEANLRLLSERVRSSREREGYLEAEAARLTSELTALLTESGALCAQQATLKADFDATTAAEEAARARAETLVEEVRALEEEVERLRSDLLELEHARAQTRAQHAAAQERLRTLRARIQRAQEQLARQSEERESVEARRAQLCTQLEQLTASRKTLAERADALWARVQQVQSELEGVRAEEQELERVHSARLERLRYLEEAQARRLGYEQGAREVLLSRADEPELWGVRGAVVDFLEVDAEYRQAVEAALGPALFALLADSLTSARSALRWLGDRANGVRFFVPELLCPCPDGSRPPEGALAARDLVRCRPEVAPFVQAALADTWVVQDLEAAIHLRTRGTRGRLVTLSGEVLSPEGVLATGRVGSDPPLGRAQELRALRTELGALEARRSRVRRHREELARQLHTLQAELREATQALRATELQAAGLEQELRVADQTLTRLHEAEAGLRSELEAAASESQELAARLERMASDLASLETELEQVRAHFRETREALASKAQELEAAREEHTRIRLRLVELQAQQEALRHRAEAVEKAERSLRERLTALQAERVALAEEIRRLVAEQEEARRTLESLRAEEEAVRSRIATLLQERDQAAKEAEGLAEAKEAAWAAVRQREEAVHRLEVRRAQLQAERSALGERVREAFGLTLEEADAAAPPELRQEELVRRVKELRMQREALGPVNLRAVEEHARVRERLEALERQVADVEEARSLLLEEVRRVEGLLEARFRKTLKEVNGTFADCFRRLFGGGHAALELVADEEGEEGIELRVQVPGKKVRDIQALSGGERVMVALALVFALLRVHPSPFCVFDEVEAALDDENTRRFVELVRELARSSQVVLITHNKATMEAADALYGVTMEEPGISRVVSVRVASSREERVRSGAE